MHFLAHLKDQGKSSKTLARHIASIRSFHQFLLREKVTDQDPSVHIETPQPERSLPKVLSMEEVEALIGCSKGEWMNTDFAIRRCLNYVCDRDAGE